MKKTFESDLINNTNMGSPLSQKEENLEILGDKIGKPGLKGEISVIPIANCFPYKRHIFNIGDLDSLAEDIKIRGLMNPIIVRSISEDYYEILSGHRRLEASKLAGSTEIKAIVVDLDDEDADQLMVTANILQRNHFTKGELVRAYKIRAEAYLHQGKQEGEQTYTLFAKEMGKSPSFAKRILYLRHLSDSLIDLMDQKKIGATAAESLRHLTDAQMEEISQYVNDNNRKLTTEEVLSLSVLKKNESAKSILDTFPEEPLRRVKSKRITISIDPYLAHIPEGSKREEIEKIITDILDNHFNVNKA